MRSAGFDIAAEAGFGRSALIFRARTLGSGRAVALKLLDEYESRASELSEAMRREAAVAARLGGNVSDPEFELVTAQDITLAELGKRVVPALVSRWFDGIPLGQWLEARRSLASRARVTNALVAALAALHGAGFAHNDLGFGNVLVGRRKIALIDFERATPPGEASGLLRLVEPNAFYDGGTDVEGEGFAHDLRAFAVLAMLVLLRIHPFSERPTDPFTREGLMSSPFRRAPHLPALGGEASMARRLGDWLGPALALAPDESAENLLQTSPLARLGHG